MKNPDRHIWVREPNESFSKHRYGWTCYRCGTYTSGQQPHSLLKVSDRFDDRVKLSCNEIVARQVLTQ